MARFTKSQCHPCPAHAQCTTSRANHRTMGFPLRELRDLQLRIRAEQQTPEWKTRYTVRSGVEGTVNGFAHGIGMRYCRYRVQEKVHIQHVLAEPSPSSSTSSASAVSHRPKKCALPADRPPSRPTLISTRSPRLKSWRTLGT
ncbi:transposase [Streptomyces sp. NPDC020965]|uniref:transposase n=1 Tax=Streptomyces sp. NPDC020965 TaxID=3365105 RepID=UPI0037AB318C